MTQISKQYPRPFREEDLERELPEGYTVQFTTYLPSSSNYPNGSVVVVYKKEENKNE